MKFKDFVTNNSNEILTGASIAGLIMSVIMAVRATPRAMKRIDKRKEELGVEKLSTWETVKTAGPCYIPTGVTMVMTTVSIVAPVNNLMKSNAALTTGLMISEEARRSFEEKTKEIVGEKKVEEIKDKIAEEKYRNAPAVVTTGRKDGYLKFVDTLVNHDFYLKSTAELDLLEKDVELDIVNYNFVSVNDWLGRIKIASVDPALGNLGWGPATDFRLRRTWIEDDDGNPVCLLSHTTPPVTREKAEGCWGS